jgi:hypothetical protein
MLTDSTMILWEILTCLGVLPIVGSRRWEPSTGIYPHLFRPRLFFEFCLYADRIRQSNGCDLTLR